MALACFIFATLFQELASIPDHKFHCPQPVQNAIPDSHFGINISAKHEMHPMNTVYQWDIINYAENLGIIWEGEDTDTLRIYVDGEANIEIQIKLVMTQTPSQSKTCNIKIIVHKPICLGIYLNEYSCIAYHINALHKTKLEYCIPTAIYFPSDAGYIHVGDNAKLYLVNDSKNVIHDIHDIIGRKYDSEQVKLFQKKHAFDLVPNHHNQIEIIIPNRNGMKISPEQAFAAIIIHLVRTATAKLHIAYHNNINVVISIPSLFHSSQRMAIKRAATIAGVNVKLLIMEQHAAAVAHIQYPYIKPNRYDWSLVMLLIVYAGKLQCSLARCAGISGLDCFILGVADNPNIGAVYLDHAINDIIINKLINDHKMKSEDIDKYIISNDIERIKNSLMETESQGSAVFYIYKFGNSHLKISITTEEIQLHPKTIELLNALMDVSNSALHNTKDITLDTLHYTITRSNIR
eukprot:272254_1